MQHFLEQSWVDFVRGVSSPEVSHNVKAHLVAGCPQCKTNCDAWSRVKKLASEESAYTPPENLVRLAKLAYESTHADQPSTSWTVANLVFDSLAQPLLAGVRSGALNAWQVIYEAEGLTIDLRLGHRGQSKELHIVGQVFDKKAVRALQDNASVELSTRQHQVVATSAVGDSGEFQLAYEAKDDLWLSLKAEGRNAVRIPLTLPR
jgi:hypothetical protein